MTGAAAMDGRDIARALYRQDLAGFIARCARALAPASTFEPNWHIDAMAYALTQVARGECRRQVITVPPRSLKSISASVAFPAWVLGRRPGTRILCVSYSRELARLHARNFRAIIEADWYCATFPDVTFDRITADLVTTTMHGTRRAATVGGSVLGDGFDIIIIDDPSKAEIARSAALRARVNAFYDDTLITRLNNKRTGAIVLLMQRQHQDDLVGHVQEKDDWNVLTIPAIADEDTVYWLGPGEHEAYLRRAGEPMHAAREGTAELEQLRRVQGSLTFAAQYQQQPAPPDGIIVRRDWIKSYVVRPPRFDLVVVSWDTASTLEENSDYSVGTVWGNVGLSYYLLDVIRGKFEAPDLRRLIEDTHRRHGARATLIEDAGIGPALAQDLRRFSRIVTPIMIKPREEKTARLQAVAPRFEAGDVHLPEDAPWKARYLDELLSFPNGRHDDQVDSTTQALSWLGRRASWRDRRHPRPMGRQYRPSGAVAATAADDDGDAPDAEHGPGAPRTAK